MRAHYQLPGRECAVGEVRMRMEVYFSCHGTASVEDALRNVRRSFIK